MTDVPAEGVRILVIEDDPMVAEVVTRYLAREGFQVDSSWEPTTT